MSPKYGDKKCPDCGSPSYITDSQQVVELNKAIRHFICSECGCEFYVVIKDPELLKYYDRIMGE